VGAGQIVGGRTHVHAGVMKHEAFELDVFALEPQAGDGVGKMGSCYLTVADRIRPHTFVETGNSVFGVCDRGNERASRDERWWRPPASSPCLAPLAARGHAGLFEPLSRLWHPGKLTLPPKNVSQGR
jgi:hypothetical protein